MLHEISLFDVIFGPNTHVGISSGILRFLHTSRFECDGVRSVCSPRPSLVPAPRRVPFPWSASRGPSPVVSVRGAPVMSQSQGSSGDGDISSGAVARTSRATKSNVRASRATGGEGTPYRNNSSWNFLATSSGSPPRVAVSRRCTPAMIPALRRIAAIGLPTQRLIGWARKLMS